MKKGFSLVEVVVAMGIFTLIASLVIGAFVMISQMRVLISITRENQQKTRVAMEMITRLSRQADKVFVQDEGRTLELHFNTDDTANFMKSRFRIGPNGELFYGECREQMCATTYNNIYRGISLKNNSGFEKTGTIPAKLRVLLNGNIDHPGVSSVAPTERRAYFSNEINLEALIILERLR